MSKEIVSPVAGSVWKVECAENDSVTEGQVLFIIESMKMEIPIEAEHAGVVHKILVKEGEPVEEEQVVCHIKG